MVAVLAVVIVSIVAVSAYEGMSGGLASSGTNTTSSSGGILVTTTSSVQTGEEIFVQVVNESGMAPMAGIAVYAGPTSSPNDVTPTWGGPYTLTECVHEVPNGAVVDNGTVVVNGTTTTTFAACPLKEYTTDSSGRMSITDPSGPFYLIEAGSNLLGWNDMVVGVEANTVINMTIPLPSGNVTAPLGSTTATQSGNVTRSATQYGFPFLWPQISTVWPCGKGLPDGSAVVPQGVYAGQYVAFSYAALQNGTNVALPEDCGVGSV
jgi:hypothetical protein